MNSVIRLTAAWLVAACFMGTFAYAGSRTGNSGAGIVCYTPQNQVGSVQLLDFFEAAQWAQPSGSFVLDLGDAGASMEQRLEHVMQGLERLDPRRAAELRTEISFFLSNVNPVTDVRFEYLPDTDPISFPRNCQVEQLAIQTTWPGLPKYNVNADLWNERVMSPEHRAGLVLHEVVYNQALQLQHENSKNARKFTAFLASTRVAAISQDDYEELVDDLHMREP